MAIEQDRRAQQIVSLITELAARLNLELVAEGVESGPVFNHLRALGIDRFQGYYVGRPQPGSSLRQTTLWQRAVLNPSSTGLIGEDGLSGSPPHP